MREQELEIEYQPVEALIPYVNNARTHSDEQVSQIAASIKEFGWTNPIILDEENGIIAGHGRLMAAKKLGMRQVPCITLEGLTEAQKKALVIADNRLALNAGWDAGMLKLEFASLKEMNFDLALTGFSLDEINIHLAPDPNEGQGDPDEEQGEPPVNPVSAPGDVWILGNHRIMCGDSTKADDVAKLLGPVKPNLMVTDPPYGVEYDADWRTTAKNGDGSLLSTGKGRAKGTVANDDKGDWREAWSLFPGDVAYVWHGEKQLVSMAEQLMDCGFNLRNLIVWGKSALVVSRGNYHSQHETCWYAVRQTGKGHWAGDRKQSTLWKIEKPKKSETGHSTQKPVECMKRPIENNSSPGQAVYDPFVGSGTTIIAAEMTGRMAFAMELKPGFVDVAVARWQTFTGLKAYRESDGALFSDLAPSVKLGIAEKPKKKRRQKTEGEADAE
jgi:DNA modification methylase